MPALSLAPVLSFFAACQRVSPVIPLRTFLRTTSERLRPPRLLPFAPCVRTAQARVLASGRALPHQLTTVLHEPHEGSLPTIVLGGFVPDATEQVFLLRGHLLKHDAIYYLNYPKAGFSLDLFCAQLDDLMTELRGRHERAPVVLAVSFGCGLVLEWLKRTSPAKSAARLSGLILVSPVACVDDLLTPGEPKPSTLLGRALQPFLQAVAASPAVVDKARAIFVRMFEAGAQNKPALRLLMTPQELGRLRTRVMDTIRCISAPGACERVQALNQMIPLPAATTQPLLLVPALILYAEKEDAVLATHSPTRRALESALCSYFPQGRVQIISHPGGTPVQHASLIFHCFNFLPALTRFYRQLKTGKFRRAA